MQSPIKMILFTDICVTSPIPLHEYLANNARLSVKLMVKGNICAETLSVNGDLKNGLWEINSSLHVKIVDRLMGVTLLAVASKQGYPDRIACIDLDLPHLLELVRKEPDGFHEFSASAGDPDSPLLQFIVTFSIKAFPWSIGSNFNLSAEAVAHLIRIRGAYANEKEAQSDLEAVVHLLVPVDDLYPYLTLVPDDNPDKPSQLNAFGRIFRSRFEHLGSLEDLEIAISSHQKAVELTRNDNPEMSSRLNGLGSVLLRRFQHLGNLTDIERSISSSQKAVDRTSDDNCDKPFFLNVLGSAFTARFDSLRSIADIDHAIANLQRAVDLTPESNPTRGSFLTNLGGTLLRRLRTRADIDNAVSMIQTASDLTADGHPDKPSRLTNLGTVLRMRFDLLVEGADLDNAILNHQRAVDIMQAGRPMNQACFNNLGISLLRRFEYISRDADVDNVIANHHAHIDQAISSLQTSVDLTPDGHPDMPHRRENLGTAFMMRFKWLGNPADPKDLEDALSAFSRAASSPTGPAMVRLRAARRWADVAGSSSRSCLDAFSCAMSLLTRVAWLGLAVADQHAVLAEVGDVVRDALAAAIKYEEYETAVVWAEQGRSIVWQNLLGLRTPVDDLRMPHPELANRLQDIALQMDKPSASGTMLESNPAVPTGDTVRRYSELAIEWENLIKQIRRIPNFESFLKPKSFSKLSPAAYEGPVVILNIQQSRCDALILIAGESGGLDNRPVSLINVPLVNFSYEKGKRLFEKLNTLLLSARARSRAPRTTELAGSNADVDTGFRVILHTLWLDVVKPVVERLAYQIQPINPPRIWWCAVGLLAFLPIHAAGLYDVDEPGQKLSDYVVSSYTPSLTTILGRSQPTVQEDFQLLTVAQPFAPGATAIPETEDEVDRIHRCAKGLSCVNLTNQGATIARVRQEMERSSWVHLACHGKQCTDKPMESGLLLHDGTLELSEIVKGSLPKADFAFLSACQTAMGDEKVAEESVHLAAGMFLAGYKGVIATMWSINDDDAPRVAEDVYSMILKGGVPDGRKAAYALQEAVKNLRKSGVGFMAWVPFIHIGR